MDRSQKIALLEAFQENRLKPEDLQPLVVPMFVEIKHGQYESGGRKYTQKQLDAYCKHFDQSCQRRAAFGLPEPFMMIVFSSVKIKPGKRPRKQCSVRNDNPAMEPTTPMVVTEDIPATVETGNDTTPAVKPDSIIATETVKKKQTVTFNLLGQIKDQEQRDRERAKKMDHFKNINSDLYD